LENTARTQLIFQGLQASAELVGQHFSFILLFFERKGIVILISECREIIKQSLHIDFVGQFQGLK